MKNRLEEFKEIQYIMETKYDNKFVKSILTSIKHDETFEKKKVLEKVNNLWEKINTMQTKTITKVEINNVDELYEVLSFIQLYSSIGSLVFTENKIKQLDDVTWPFIYCDLNKFKENALELFSKKNSDYGDAFANYGVIGVIIRMGDKIARINSLCINKSKIVEETIMDSFVDLYNYSIMALMLIKNDR